MPIDNIDLPVAECVNEKYNSLAFWVVVIYFSCEIVSGLRVDWHPFDLFWCDIAHWPPTFNFKDKPAPALAKPLIDGAPEPSCIFA